MTITIDIRPEVQAELARHAAAFGRDLESHAGRVLEEASRVRMERLSADEQSRVAMAGNLMELFAPVRGLLTDEEVDTLFSRNRSAGRTVDLA